MTNYDYFSNSNSYNKNYNYNNSSSYINKNSEKTLSTYHLSNTFKQKKKNPEDSSEFFEIFGLKLFSFLNF